MPALTRFVDGTGPIFAGKIFPFCFITIACGAISGFHALISSGTTPKMIAKESNARPVGYGSMLLESFVAIMALIAACVLAAGRFLRGEFAGGSRRHDAGGGGRRRSPVWGFPVTAPRCSSSPPTSARRRCSIAPAARRRSRSAWRTSFAFVRRRPRAARLLVSLRHHVRGAVHPDHHRRRHARRAIHAAGSAAATCRAA